MCSRHHRGSSEVTTAAADTEEKLRCSCPTGVPPQRKSSGQQPPLNNIARRVITNNVSITYPSLGERDDQSSVDASREVINCAATTRHTYRALARLAVASFASMAACAGHWNPESGYYRNFFNFFLCRIHFSQPAQQDPNADNPASWYRQIRSTSVSTLD
jgi:hypothetical protein